MNTETNNTANINTVDEIKIFENIDNSLVWSRETYLGTNRETNIKDKSVHIYQVQELNDILYRGKSYQKSENKFKQILKQYRK
jgi:hypothetical protein